MMMVTMMMVVVLLLLFDAYSCSFEDHSEELCRHSRHASGQWVKYRSRRTPQSKAFYCCGVLDNDYQWNETICGHVKRMSPLNFTGINDKPMAAFDRACNKEKLRNERMNVSLAESYVWEPFFCNLIPWSGERFCQLLGMWTEGVIAVATVDHSIIDRC